ncbi:MAG TPA: DUF6249 domain-containing protein [Blastocatellia bacterium]|nr:DUF6249 domain-containing protein [Blastocatellia bacterium]
MDRDTTAMATHLAEVTKKTRPQQCEDGISYEEKRYNEIKGGVVTSCVGIGIMIFLYVIMRGIILSGQNPPGDAEILGRVWVAGMIPFFVGVGRLVSGLFVRKEWVAAARVGGQAKEPASEIKPLTQGEEGHSVFAADWYESGSSRASVTENTTRQLSNPNQVR